MLRKLRRSGPRYGRRNIADRKDIEADVLRQRRDLYAIAIGLAIYNLAGGYVAESTTLGILPMRLSHPWVVLAAAWLGLAYFWWRFWLISEVKPFGAFHEDAMWQAGHSRIGRELAGRHASPTQFYNTPARTSDENRVLIAAPTGPVPRYSIPGFKPTVNLMELHRDAVAAKRTVLAESYGLGPIEFPEGQRARAWRVLLTGYWRAIWRERAFSDYTAPHLFALFTVATGFVHFFVF